MSIVFSSQGSAGGTAYMAESGLLFFFVNKLGGAAGDKYHTKQKKRCLIRMGNNFVNQQVINCRAGGRVLFL